MRARASGLLALFVAAGGCDEPDLVTNGGRIGLDLPEVYWPPRLPLDRDVPVAAGSRWCPLLAGYYGEPRDRETWRAVEGLGDCYETAVDGPATWDGSCAHLGAPGQMSVTMTPRACEPRDHGSIPDEIETLSIEIADATTLAGRLHPNLDALVERYLAPEPDETRVGQFPPGWRPGPGEALLVAEGGWVAVSPGLVDAKGAEVAWTDGAMLGLPEHGIVTEDEGLDFAIVAEEGMRFSPTLALPRGQIRLGEVRSVAVEVATSLEIVAAYGYRWGRPLDEPEATDWIDEVHLRALVHDEDGRPVYGMPIEWRVIDGHVALEPGGAFRHKPGVPPDYASVLDVCLGPRASPEPRHATVEARLGELVDTIEVTLPEGLDHIAEGWPSEEMLAACEGPTAPARGCACRVDRRAPSPIPWPFAIVVIAGTLRPRAGADRRRRA